jgi:hypothetical protein
MANQYDEYFIHPEDIELVLPWEMYCHNQNQKQAEIARIREQIRNFDTTIPPYPAEDFEGMSSEEFLSEEEWREAALSNLNDDYHALQKQHRELEAEIRNSPAAQKPRYLYFKSRKQYCAFFNLPYKIGDSRQ